jgi:hypothetical protein
VCFSFIAPLLVSCASVPPGSPDNLCSIFSNRPDWYHASLDAEKRWGTPVAIQLAFLRHESAFDADARPPRDRLLGFIPWFRSSSAYGYAQAQDSTWEWYRESSGNSGADRDDYSDSTDFVAWYVAKSRQMLRLSQTDAYRNYLAYHEGHGGYRRGTWQDKSWLVAYAKKVSATYSRYQRQLATCGQRLRPEASSWWWPF